MSKIILDQLLEGNKRFASNNSAFDGVNAERRLQGLHGQRPKAIVVGCADSRVAPELIFDQGLGDLFVLRVAGNIIDDAIIGSIEYAVAELGTELIVVLGHTDCGAVKASVDHKGEEIAGKMSAFIEAIKPAVEEAKKQGGNLLDQAIRANAKHVAKSLESQGDIIATAVKEGRLMIVPAKYHFNTGKVEILSETFA